MKYDNFINDIKTCKAVIRSLEIIGEAVKQIPEEIKKLSDYKYWKQIASMRDRLIHEYFGVDYSLVWMSIEEDLPDLKVEIEKLLNIIR